MLSKWFDQGPEALKSGRATWQGYQAVRHERTIPQRLDDLRALIAGRWLPPGAAAAELARLSFDCLGPIPSVIAELRRLVGRLGRRGGAADRVRATLACALAEISESAEAVEVMRPVIERRGARGLDLASIALVDQMQLLGFDQGRVGAECAALMAAQPAQQQGFEALLADRSVSIALVGNAPVERGRGRGAEICAKDVVIRFNNYSDDVAHEADYGRRTDVWARAATHTTVWRRPAQAYDFVVFTGVDRRFHGPKFWDVLEAARSGAALAFVPTRIYVDLVARLKYPPSAGMQLLYWLRSLRGPFADGNVFAYGFSTDDQGQSPNARVPHRPHGPTEGAFLRSEILA